MSSIRETAIVDAPPEDVWLVVADVRNLPRWNSHIREVVDAPDRELRAGDSYRVKMRFVGVTSWVRAEVLEIEPVSYSMIRLSGIVNATVRTVVKPVGDRRTHLEHEIDYHFPGGPVGELAARTVRHLGAPAILRRGVRAQKEQVEEG